MTNHRNKVPPHEKRTPINCPELIDVWKNKYDELIEHHRKWRCLEMIGNEYGVNRTTVEYHLFPVRKIKQKNFESRKWAYEKADPEIHQKRIAYKQQYMHLRRHIDEYIEQAYQCVPITESLTLDELSRNIELQTGIALAPDTILGLNQKYRDKRGNSLINKVSGDVPDRYRLNLDW